MKLEFLSFVSFSAENEQKKNTGKIDSLESTLSDDDSRSL